MCFYDRVNVCTAYSAIEDVEVVAVAVSHFARMISTGKLDLPPPPESVPLCPVHIDSAICTCLLGIDDAYAPFKKNNGS